MLFILACVAACLVVLDWVLNQNERAKTVAKIPGPKRKFIVGHLFDVIRSPTDLFAWGRALAAAANGIYSIWVYPLSVINIYNPEDIETVIATTRFNNKSKAYKFLQPWLQDGLLISKGSKWQKRRKILTPAFHFNILKEFCVILEENSLRLVDRLKKTEGKSVDIIPLVSEYTLHSICETAMGYKLEDTKCAGNSYKEALYALGWVIVERFSKIYLISDFIFGLTKLKKKQDEQLKVLHSFTNTVIEERKEYIRDHGINVFEGSHIDDTFMSGRKKKIAMLDLLICAEKDGLIDSKGIQEEVDTFMFEVVKQLHLDTKELLQQYVHGHDTTASGLTHILMALANHKDIQDKVLAELTEVLGDDVDQQASMDQLNSLRYLDCVIKEGLRLYPPVPFISRHIGEEVELSKYKIPEDTYCHIHIFDLHRREDLFRNAQEFDPDRFLPENCVGRHPYAYIPFSAGPRNCIGQRFAILEMKSCLAAILRNFVLDPVTKEKDIIFTSDLVLRTNHPIYVKFVPRNK